MKISDKVIDLIKSFEGLRLQSYLCEARKWTIGYGHTRTARLGQTITKEQAEELLISDLEPTEAAVNYLNSKLANPLNQNEFDSLCSLIYNIGIGAFNNSTLKRKLLEDINRSEVAKEFIKWVNVDGVQNKGLTNRRIVEQKLFMS